MVGLIGRWNFSQRICCIFIKMPIKICQINSKVQGSIPQVDFPGPKISQTSKLKKNNPRTTLAFDSPSTPTIALALQFCPNQLTSCSHHSHFSLSLSHFCLNQSVDIMIMIMFPPLSLNLVTSIRDQNNNQTSGTY